MIYDCHYELCYLILHPMHPIFFWNCSPSCRGRKGGIVPVICLNHNAWVASVLRQGHPPSPLRSRAKKTNAARGNCAFVAGLGGEVFGGWRGYIFWENGVLYCYVIYFYLVDCLCFKLFFGLVVTPHAPHLFGEFLAKAERTQRDFCHLSEPWFVR